MVPVDLEDIEVLLFDLGNVVFRIDFQRAIARWAADAGVAAEGLRQRFALDAAYERHERGEIEAPAYFDALRARLAIDLDDAAMAAGWNAIYAEPMEAVVAILPQLASRRRLVAFTNTNAMHETVWSRRYAAELRHFSGIYLSCHLGLRKPDIESYAAVARDLRTEPERVLFFDDTAENVRGAREAGMWAVQVRSPTDVRAAVAPLLS